MMKNVNTRVNIFMGSTSNWHSMEKTCITAEVFMTNIGFYKNLYKHKTN
jgi:phosphoribosylcarboxyaminoimidazole (NCAIR) mutase